MKGSHFFGSGLILVYCFTYSFLEEDTTNKIVKGEREETDSDVRLKQGRYLVLIDPLHKETVSENLFIFQLKFNFQVSNQNILFFSIELA
jgi:hypothetical protein